MGQGMVAFIEYDEDLSNPVPFSSGDSVWSTTEAEGLRFEKNYDFFAAIAGVRNYRGILPLYPPRGLPPVLSPAARMLLSNGWTAPGWLLLPEIRAALDHMSIKPENLDLIVQVHLDTMAILERHLGADRVRLVFAFP